MPWLPSPSHEDDAETCLAEGNWTCRCQHPLFETESIFPSQHQATAYQHRISSPTTVALQRERQRRLALTSSRLPSLGPATSTTAVSFRGWKITSAAQSVVVKCVIGRPKIHGGREDAALNGAKPRRRGTVERTVHGWRRISGTAMSRVWDARVCVYTQ